MKLEFDFKSPERVVEFTYLDGKEYKVRKFSSLTVEELREIGGDGAAAQRAQKVMDFLLAEAGLPDVNNMPQDFVVKLAEAMNGNQLGE